MALATRCPACSTVFRIGTAQAAAKGGMVRCGICANVFNSLDALVRVEELDVVEEVIVAPAALALAVPSVDSAKPMITPRPVAQNVDDDALEAPESPTAASSDAAATPALQHDAEIAWTPGPMLEPAASPTTSWEAVSLPEPEPMQPDAPVSSGAPSLPEAPVVAARAADRIEPTLSDASGNAVIREWWMPEASPAERAPLSGPITPPYSGRPTETREPSSPLLSDRRDEERTGGSTLDGANPVFMKSDAEPERGSRAMRWVLGVLSLIAAAALLAQLAYLWRDEIAARWSPARPWLAAACRVLDCELGYPTHPAAITIESATVTSAGSNSSPNSNIYVLAALLRNRDALDLRYPHLELVLTDLQDRPILRRDLRPEDYLGPTLSPTSGFAAQSELPIRITFELDDLRFAGYRLNQFYP